MIQSYGLNIVQHFWFPFEKQMKFQPFSLNHSDYFCIKRAFKERLCSLNKQIIVINIQAQLYIRQQKMSVWTLMATVYLQNETCSDLCLFSVLIKQVKTTHKCKCTAMHEAVRPPCNSPGLLQALSRFDLCPGPALIVFYLQK